MADRTSSEGLQEAAVENLSSLLAEDWRTEAVVPFSDRRKQPRARTRFSIDRAASALTDSKSAVAQAFDDISSGRLPDVPALKESVDQLGLIVEQNPHAIVSMTRMKARHEYTYLHSVAVSALMMAMGRKLGFQRPAVRQLGLAGLLHDIGKAHVPVELLDKPSALEPEERQLMFSHAERGHAILEAAGTVDDVTLSVCRHHHERLDGSGYPDGLTGEDLSTEVRIAAICDVFDALTSSRAYKEAWTPAQALTWMTGAEGHFDRDLLGKFRTLLGTFPIGTFVRLQSGRLGTVLADPTADPRHPQVSISRCALSGRELGSIIVDTSHDPIIGIELEDRWTANNKAARNWK